MFRFLTTFLAAAFASSAGAAAAPDGDRVGRWDPRPFAAERSVAYVVTQESPAARRRSRSRTAGAAIFYFSPDGTILRVAEPSDILAPRGARAAGGGVVLFADVFLPGIMQLSPTGEVSRLYSGSPLKGPKDLAFDGAGNLAIADFESFERTRDQGVYLWDRRTGQVRSIYRGRPLDQPHGIDVDSQGNYIVADHSGSIYRVSPAGRIETIASGPPLVAPQDIKVQKDGSYIVTDIGIVIDTGTGSVVPARSRHPGRLFRVTPGGETTLVYQQPRARFRAVANHPDGGWVVVNMGTLRPPGAHAGSLIRVYPDGSGRVIHTGAPFYQPAGVAVIY